jgi:hypothetical protein
VGRNPLHTADKSGKQRMGGVVSELFETIPVGTVVDRFLEEKWM